MRLGLATNAANGERAGGPPLAGFRPLELIGRGGRGEVWKAEAPGGFPVALKFVPLAAPRRRPT